MLYSKGMEDTPAYQKFMNGQFRTKEDVLRSLGRKVKKYEDASKTDHVTPMAFYTMLGTLITQFIENIENAVLFDELPSWWIYDYDLEYDRFVMYMEHVKEFNVNDETGDSGGWVCDARYNLVGFSFKTLSASEYAELYGVNVGTVRQWIRRGKLRTATKIGAEWRIPILTVPPERGYDQAQYVWHEPMEDLPEEYQFLNDFKLATFFRDREDRDKFHVLLVAKSTEDHNDLSGNKELILDAKEREKLELIMISRPEIRYSLRY